MLVRFLSCLLTCCFDGELAGGNPPLIISCVSDGRTASSKGIVAKCFS